MTGLTAATPAIQKEQQKAALQRLVQRAILVNAAKEQGIDKDPAFALLAQRATDVVMVQMLERKVVASVPAPSGEEVAQFMQTNPDMFAQRRLFDVEQIRMPLPSDPKIIKQLEPLKTMDEVAAFLAKQNISFQRGANVMDARGRIPSFSRRLSRCRRARFSSFRRGRRSFSIRSATRGSCPLKARRPRSSP